MFKAASSLVRTFNEFCSKSVVILINPQTYKERRYFKGTEITVQDITDAYNDWDAVSFTTIDNAAFVYKLMHFIEETKANGLEEFEGLDIPKGLDESLELVRETNFFNKSSTMEEVIEKPYLLLDVDFKDNAEYMKKVEAIPPERADLDKEKFYSYIKNMTEEAKVGLVTKMFKANALHNLSPDLVMMSGNGVHLWFNCIGHITSELYNLYYDSICKEFLETFPGIKIDRNAGCVNQNLRLPGSVNHKCPKKVTSQIISCNLASHDKYPLFKEIDKQIKEGNISVPEPGKFKNKGRTTTTYKNTNWDAESLIQGNETKKPGLKQIQKDKRMYLFIKDWLTFAGIMSWLDLDIKNASVITGGIKCSNPLREDNNPSLLVSDASLHVTDLADKKNTSIDYGELMRRLLIMRKEHLGLVNFTTRYEAQYHCMIVAYINYINKTGNKTLPMIDAKKHEEWLKEMQALNGWTNIPASMKQPKGKSYYEHLQWSFTTIIQQYKPADNGQSSFSSIVGVIPKVFYMYVLNDDTSQASTSIRNSAITLSLIYLFQDLQISIRANPKTNRLEVYVLNSEGIHEEWSVGYPYGYSKGSSNTTKTHYAKMEQRLLQMGLATVQDSNTGLSPIPRAVEGAFCALRDLPEFLNDHYDPTKPVNSYTLTDMISTIIQRQVPGIIVSRKDIPVHVLDDKKYILFNNGFVIYDCDDSSKIGKFVARTNKNRVEILTQSLVPLRIKLMYNSSKNYLEKIPYWKHYLTSMTYEDNFFEKVMSFIVGRMLTPADSESRLVYFCGQGGSGKSVGYEVLSALLTSSNNRYVTSIPIEDLSCSQAQGQQARAAIQHAIINISPDNTRSTLDTTFKNMIQGESVQVRNLYEDQRTVRMKALFIANTNTPPTITREHGAFIRRMLLVNVDRKIKEEDKIIGLSGLIIEKELPYVWQWIMEQIRIFKEKGISGFLSAEDIRLLQEPLEQTNEVQEFIDHFIEYDPAEPCKLSWSNFKKAINTYRLLDGKNPIKSDTVKHEVNTAIRNSKTLKALLGEDHLYLIKGLDTRIESKRGIPGCWIYIPKGVINNDMPIDSRTYGTGS